MDTLVLNSAFYPVDRIPWTEAVSDLLAGRAEVVEVFEDRTVRSGASAMTGFLPKTFEPLRTSTLGVWKIPSIIRFLGKAIFHHGYVKFNRHNVWLRDKGTCQYCGKKQSLSEFTYDHVVPQSRGGETCWTNIVVACGPCNRRKANKTPEESKMRLICKPFRPTSVPGQVSPVLQWKEGMPDSWRSFLESVRYWHAELT